MKRHICALLAVAMLLASPLVARADVFNFAGLTLDQLYEVRLHLDEQIAVMESQSGLRVYESGGYLVGRDIPAGDYVLYENGDAVFASAVVRAGDSEDSDLVTYHLVNQQAVIRLEPETWLTLSETRACPIAQAADVLDENGRTGEGGFLVGVQLPAGRYTVSPVEKAPLSSYSVYGDILGSGAQLLKFEVLHEDVALQLQDGEYVELAGCTLTRLD